MLTHWPRLPRALRPLLPVAFLAVSVFSLDTACAGENAAASRYGQRPAAANDYELQCVAFLQGDLEAAYHLGWLRFSGRDVPADNARAAGWFRLAAQHGDPHSQRILDELLPGTRPSDDAGCPPRHGRADRATIEAWIDVLAPGYGLDAELLHAVVEVESRFNPRARSPKNARGLMQLLPSTARRFEVDDIWDPFENLQGGMAYLRWLLDHFDNDLDLSLAAYNAGEQVVNHYGGIPPYRETRDYVRNVNRLYNRAVR